MSWMNSSLMPDSSYEEDHGGGFGLGLVTLLMGVALGAATALLLAPKSGTQLREEVAGAAEDWKSHVAEAITQGREKIVSAVESGRVKSPESEEANGKVRDPA